MTTRNDYLSRFKNIAAAVKFEDSVLSIGDEFLPEIARAVRDGHALPNGEYWQFLISQIDS